MNGLRSDGRRPDQMRDVRITTGFLLTAEGSALIEIGNTRVLCAATVEDSLPQWLRGSGRGWVTAEYAMLPRSTVTRTQRESIRGKPSGRTHEIQRLIGRSLRAALDLTALGDRTVILDCDVLQADGGTRTAAITGAFVALSLAVERLIECGALRRSPVSDPVSAVSVGIVGGVPMLDLNYDEDSRAEVDMNVVLTGSGKLAEIQATAEHKPFDEEQMGQLLSLARQGAAYLIEVQKRALGRA